MSFLIYLILQMHGAGVTTKAPDGPPVHVPICIPGHPKCNRPPPVVNQPRGHR